MSTRRAERRGVAWIVIGFLICPCHLPLTLAVVAGLFAGTAAGALVSAHPVAAGLLVSVAWVLMTWRGFRLLRSGD